MYDKLTLRDLIKSYPEYKVYAQFITNSTVMAVAMYAIALWMFLNKYKKFVIISANFGAKRKDIMKMFIEKALGYSFITCAISTVLTYGYLAIINENKITIFLILQLQIILIILTVILSALRVKLSYDEFEKRSCMIKDNIKLGLMDVFRNKVVFCLMLLLIFSLGTIVESATDSYLRNTFAEFQLSEQAYSAVVLETTDDKGYDYSNTYGKNWTIYF